MNRKEAKEMFKCDKDAYGKPKAVMSKIDKIYNEFEKESLEFPDIRNKLSPITHLMVMVKNDNWDGARKALEQCKVSINYLADREVYYMPPKYVKLCNSELVLDELDETYHRHAGGWNTGYELKNGKLISTDVMAGEEFIPITKEEWKKGNEGSI